MTEDLKTCRACGYTRKWDDLAPDYECPKCERIYAKSDLEEPAPAMSREATVEDDPFDVIDEPGSNWARRAMIAIATVGVVAGGGYFFYADHQSQLAEHAANLDAIQRVQRIAEKWDDTMRVLEVTPRLTAGGPVSELQALHRDLRNMSVPACVNPARESLVKATSLHLDAIMSVLRNDEQKAKQIMERYNDEMQVFSKVSLDCQ